LQNAKDGSLARPKPGNRLKSSFAGSFAMLNAIYAAQQLSGSNRRIVVTQAVTARDECRLLVDTSTGHDPMNEEPSVSRIQHDFAIGNFGNINALNGDQTTGENGGNHARAKNTDANLAESADDSFREFASVPIG